MTDDEELEPFEEEEELTDDEKAEIENGECCASCGATFAEEQGEAALCTSCWDKADADGRVGFIRSNSSTLAD